MENQEGGMSYYLNIDGEQVGQLASNSGWGDFGRWAESLDADNHGEVALLYRNGGSDTLDTLETELRDAMKTSPPEAGDTRATAESLLKMILDRPAGTETISVSDGLEDDD